MEVDGDSVGVGNCEDVEVDGDGVGLGTCEGLEVMVKV